MSARRFTTCWIDQNDVLHLDRKNCPQLAELAEAGVNVRRTLRKVRVYLPGYARNPEPLCAAPCRSCAIADVVAALLAGTRRTPLLSRSAFVQFNLEAPGDTEGVEVETQHRRYSRQHMAHVAAAGSLILSSDARGPFGYGFVQPDVADALEALVRFRETPSSVPDDAAIRRTVDA